MQVTWGECKEEGEEPAILMAPTLLESHQCKMHQPASRECRRLQLRLQQNLISRRSLVTALRRHRPESVFRSQREHQRTISSQLITVCNHNCTPKTVDVHQASRTTRIPLRPTRRIPVFALNLSRSSHRHLSSHFGRNTQDCQVLVTGLQRPRVLTRLEISHRSRLRHLGAGTRGSSTCSPTLPALKMKGWTKPPMRRITTSMPSRLQTHRG